MSFKDNLKAIRLGLGLTQLEASIHCGFSSVQFNHYETGRREPKFDNLRK